jgi:hypothetical protein
VSKFLANLSTESTQNFSQYNTSQYNHLDKNSSNIRLLPLNANAIKKLRIMLRLDEFAIDKSSSNNSSESNGQAKKEKDYSNVCHDTNTLSSKLVNNNNNGDNANIPLLLVTEKSDLNLKKTSKVSVQTNKKKSINSPPTFDKPKYKKTSIVDETAFKLAGLSNSYINRKSSISTNTECTDEGDFSIKISFNDRSLAPPPSPFSDMTHVHSQLCVMCEKEASFVNNQMSEIVENQTD